MLITLKYSFAVADLRGGARDARPPPGPKFFHFHAVFDQKNRFAHPLRELAPPLGKILDPPLLWYGIWEWSHQLCVITALCASHDTPMDFSILFSAISTERYAK